MWVVLPAVREVSGHGETTRVVPIYNSKMKLTVRVDEPQQAPGLTILHDAIAKNICEVLNTATY
jgi:hypothetical protein